MGSQGIDWKRVGDTIRRARRVALRPAAESFGVRYQALWRLERGEYKSAECLLRVCAGLNIDPLKLTGLRE